MTRKGRAHYKSNQEESRRQRSRTERSYNLDDNKKQLDNKIKEGVRKVEQTKTRIGKVGNRKLTERRDGQTMAFREVGREDLQPQRGTGTRLGFREEARRIRGEGVCRSPYASLNTHIIYISHSGFPKRHNLALAAPRCHLFQSGTSLWRLGFGTNKFSTN